MDGFKLKNIKISIRISIITLFILLFATIGSLIIAINYAAVNKLLLNTSQNLMSHSATLIKQRLDIYLHPLDEGLLKVGGLLSKKIINPNDKSQYKAYLYELVHDNPDIYGAYWGTPDGGFYGIDREAGHLTLQAITRSTQGGTSLRYILGQNEKIIKTIELPTNYDPRSRQWYQDALTAKRAIWTGVYPFYIFGSEDEHRPGITAAIPIYDEQQQLLGVFGVDLTIHRFINFIQQLQVTPNALIYVIDQLNQVVAYSDHSKDQALIGKELTPDAIKELQIPLPPTQTQATEGITHYHVNGKDYFATVQSLAHQMGESWQVAIIIPVNDISAPLKRTSLKALILTVISLLIGIVLIHYISQRISKPIMLLADNAKTLTELAPTQPIILRTIIKEIHYMNNTLIAIHKSLTSFQRYVPKSLVKKLISSNIIAEVGGEHREMSFLFSDIQDFTRIAERTEPQKLMQLLSRYFEKITHAIIHTGGTLDKYIGDGVMAFWNAPTTDEQHALHACQTAVQILDAVATLNLQGQQQQFPDLSLRIGIHSGFATVGNVGSEERLSYTAIGDSVNVASRLEALNKIYGTHILVSQVTYQQVKDHFIFRLIDEVAVRGKQQSITVYELVTDKEKSEVEAYQQQFNAAFSLYQQGQWQSSWDLFKGLADKYPQDKVAHVFMERCQILSQANPSQWDGIWRMGYER